MTPDNFNIDVEQINPLSYNTSTENIEEANQAAAVETSEANEQAAATNTQGEEKQEAYDTGGRNRPDQPTSDDGTLDYLQSTPDEQLPEGYVPSTEKKNLGQAGGDILAGGILDSMEGIWTFAGRMYDAFTGKADEAGETYRPKGMFFDEENDIDYNPITQETAIGKFGRDAVSWAVTTGTVIGGIALAKATLPITLPVAGFLGVGLTVKKAVAWLGGAGMIVDAIDMKSADDNISGAIAETEWMQSATKAFPFLWNPVATNDTDSIMTKTFKNVLEAGMLNGGVGTLYGIFSKGKGAQNAIEGVATKPDRGLTFVDDNARLADQLWQERTAQAKSLRFQDADADLRDAVAKQYFRKAKGQSQFEDLAEEDQIALMTEAYYKNPDKYEGWSPPNEAAEERGLRKVVEMNASQNKQITDAGYEELASPEMGGFKGKGTISDAQQGNAISGNTVTNVADQIHNMRNTINGEYGSTDTLITPAQIKRSNLIEDISGEELNEVAITMMEKERWANVIGELKELGKNPREIFPEAYKAHREMIEGRNITEKSAEEFWKRFDDDISFRTGGEDSRDAWAVKNVVSADMSIASVFKRMRDLGVAARETATVLDPFDVDGPGAQLLETLEYGLFNVKKSRMLWSQMGREFQTEAGAESVKKKLMAIRKETKAQVGLMKKLAMESPSQELSDALIEIFSWSNNIRNWEDVTEVFRARLRGGKFGGKKYDSMLLKELQGVMVHSVLTGPKTPLRAMMGTATATFLRPISQVLGGVGVMDKTQIQEGLAGMAGMVNAIPDSWKLFKRNLHSYWTGDMSTIKTRYGVMDKRDEAWEAMGQWMMEHGTEGDKAAYLWGNFARGLNDNSLLTYSSKIMAAMDDSFSYIMARSRSRVRAMQDALEVQKLGRTPEITPELMKTFEAKYMDKFVDAKTGRIKVGEDIALDHAAQEATLTRDLSGWSASFANLFSSNPWTKPFFLFARTGINGVKLSVSHMPLFKFMLGQERRILNATMEQADLGQLADLGIANSADLMNAKAIQRGRSIIGGSVITLAAQKVMAGELTGNGSPDRGVREAQKMGDWQPRSIKIGERWISYDSFEPFNVLLAYVADVADSYELMGQEWVEDKFQKAALAAVGSGVTKSYLSGLTQVVDLLSGEPGQIELMAASLVNNTVPMGGLRNEIGKVLNPYMKELNREFGDQVRNRNQVSEFLSGEPLPIKTDILYGDPIRNWNLPTRLFNMFSPVAINPDYSPGRALLFNSGYDMRTIALRPDGVDLSKENELRADYQAALGQQGIGKQLDDLARHPKAQESLREMEEDKDNNRQGKEPRDYWVNIRINDIFTRASEAAWNEVRRSPRAQLLIQQKNLLQQSRASQRIGSKAQSDRQYDELQELRQMFIK